eukprot:7965836-Pyramimonas_sp.AAC.1
MPLGISSDVLRELLGVLVGRLKVFLTVFGVSCGVLGTCGGPLRAVWGSLGRLFEAFWGRLGGLLRLRGTSCSRGGVPY